MKRVFIAIKVDAPLASRILSWQKDQDKSLKIRWISKDNLHLTLVPPWYEKEIDKIKVSLDGLNLDFPPFEIVFKKISIGPDNKHPRLIWVEGSVTEDILSLKNEIEKILSEIPEKRKFKLHITLGRFKEGDFDSIERRIKTGSIFWKMRVSSFHLFESRLLPKGAEYEVLKEIKLQ